MFLHPVLDNLVGEAWLRPENQHLMAPPYLCPAISWWCEARLQDCASGSAAGLRCDPTKAAITVKSTEN